MIYSQLVVWNSTKCARQIQHIFYIMHQWGKPTEMWLQDHKYKGPFWNFGNQRFFSSPSLISLTLYKVILQETQANSFVFLCNPHNEGSTFCLSPRLPFKSVGVWPRLPPERLTCTVRHSREPVVTSVPVRVIWHCQSSAILSDPAEHLEEGGNWVHAVEKVQRNGEIENCGPYAEAKCLLFQPVVVLWPAAKGRKDPQLKEGKKLNELNLL